MSRFLLVCLTLPLLFAVVACNRPNPVPSAGGVEQLEHFSGTVDNSRVTYDPVRSDLSVRAANALKAGDAETAVMLNREKVARYPSDHVVYEDLASCLYFQNQHDAAETEYRHALRLNAQSARALYGLGCVACARRKYTEAVDYYEQALAIDPNYPGCHRAIAQTAEDIGDKAKAEYHYKQAGAIDGRKK